MKNNPAIFLKLLVLLVPREMEVTHKGGIKSMTDDELERGIEAIKAMLAAREAGENAKVIEGVAEPAAKPVKRRKERRRVTPALPLAKPATE